MSRNVLINGGLALASWGICGGLVWLLWEGVKFGASFQ